MMGETSYKASMPQTFEKVYHIAISGAGIPGLSLALGAARLGLSVAVIDHRERLDTELDTRTTALLPESLHFLDSLGLLIPVLSRAQPLRRMRLMNDQGALRDRPRGLTFDSGTQEPLALNIPNKVLFDALARKLCKYDTQVKMFWDASLIAAGPDRGQARMHLGTGQSLVACLGVAADGRCSPLRHHLGIGWHQASDHQAAVTARLRHTKPHEGVSTEFHRQAGPMTFVPVAGDEHDSALVWCMGKANAQSLVKAPDADFLAWVQMASHDILGHLESAVWRGLFPIKPGIAKALCKGPFVLVAEAAHVLPPLLAQGLNLSLKDVEVLLTNLSDFGVGKKAVAAYASRRWADILARFTVSQGLNMFLSHAPAPLAAAYAVGHAGLCASPWARKWAVRLGQRGKQNMP